MHRLAVGAGGAAPGGPVLVDEHAGGRRCRVRLQPGVRRGQSGDLPGLRASGGAHRPAPSAGTGGAPGERRRRERGGGGARGAHRLRRAVLGDPRNRGGGARGRPVARRHRGGDVLRGGAAAPAHRLRQPLRRASAHRHQYPALSARGAGGEACATRCWRSSAGPAAPKSGSASTGCAGRGASTADRTSAAIGTRCSTS